MSRTRRQYFEETGVSLVIIKDKFGTSEGRARLSEEDKDLESRFTGLTIAEMKAKIERERKRKARAAEVLNKARKEVQRAFVYHIERVKRHEKLQKELESYLETKEKFRKTFRDIQIKKGKNKI